MKNKEKSFGAANSYNEHLNRTYIKQKEEQQDELNYLSGLAFEKFGFVENDIDDITQRIDKKLGLRVPQSPSGLNKQIGLNTIFIALLSGLFIGVSVFFVIFNKSKNHASVYQKLESENTQLEKALANNIIAADTVFNIPQETKRLAQEHFTSKDELINIDEAPDLLENLEMKSATIPFSNIEIKEEALSNYIPNSPVVFISNLKIANYKGYYFKQNYAIDLSLNTGLSAQFENEKQIQKAQRNRNSNYFAHIILQKAMKCFFQKQFDMSIEELQALNEYNKDDANAQFYLGMSFFEKQQYTKALNYFNTNLNNSINIFHQESEFYKAMCLLKTNQTDEAKKLFFVIIKNNGFYAARAGDLIR